MISERSFAFNSADPDLSLLGLSLPLDRDVSEQKRLSGAAAAAPGGGAPGPPLSPPPGSAAPPGAPLPAASRPSLTAPAARRAPPRTARAPQEGLSARRGKVLLVGFAAAG